LNGQISHIFLQGLFAKPCANKKEPEELCDASSCLEDLLIQVYFPMNEAQGFVQSPKGFESEHRFIDKKINTTLQVLVRWRTNIHHDRFSMSIHISLHAISSAKNDYLK
jgi:hypothetical protein